MSESTSAKKLKQMRLPFSPLTSPKGVTAPVPPKSSEITSPKSSTAARKRKPSSDPDIARSTKIGRKSLKENIATETDIVEIIDTSNDKTTENPNEIVIETSSEADGDQLHIKLPISTKKKPIPDTKPQKNVEDEDAEDSIVYLDKDDVKSQKEPRKSSKKKKKETSSAVEAQKIDEEEIIDETPQPEASEVAVNIMTDEAMPESNEFSPKSFDTIPSTKVSPEKDDEQEEFNDEIADVLTDFSEDLNASATSMKDENGKKINPQMSDITKLTPRQLERRKLLETRRLEKEKQKQQERELKEQQRLKEKEIREEAKRKDREEKEEARRKEKEERDKKKQAEIDKKELERKQKEDERKKIQDQRDEEKRLKEEERKKQAELKDEEKRQKEEEKRLKDEEKRKKEIGEENKKKKASEALMRYVKVAPKKKPENLADDEGSKESNNSNGGVVKQNFDMFVVRNRMKLAPVVRHHLDKSQRSFLDEVISGKQFDKSYINEIKSKERKPLKTGSTLKTDKDDDDSVVLVDELEGLGEDILIDETKLKSNLRRKFLMFTENRRPAYGGTWQKLTKSITARRPFAKDDKFFDYDVDSDDEWEEEEPGESLHGSESEKEKEDEDDYEMDEFMVPHGHLSDEEIKQMESDDDDNSPETQKAKIKIMQQEFAEEMKKKTEKIKPRLIGCIFINGNEDEHGASIKNDQKSYHCSNIIWRILKARQVWSREESIDFVYENEVVESEEEPAKSTKTPQQKQQAKAKFNDTILRDLVRLVHGNVNGKKFIMKEFQAYRLKNFHNTPDFLEFSLKGIEEKLNEICEYKSCPEEGPMFGKKCWYVKADVIQQLFGDEKLKLPNEWKYILEKEVKEKKVKTTTPPKEDEKKDKEIAMPAAATSTTKKRVQLLQSVPLGESFQKKTQVKKSPEKRKSPVKDNPAVAKKRVPILMSVPLSETVNKEKKSEIMRRFLQKTKTSTEAEKNVAVATKNGAEEMEVDDAN